MAFRLIVGPRIEFLNVQALVAVLLPVSAHDMAKPFLLSHSTYFLNRSSAGQNLKRLGDQRNRETALDSLHKAVKAFKLHADPFATGRPNNNWADLC
jgi:hypothetical protein